MPLNNEFAKKSLKQVNKCEYVQKESGNANLNIGYLCKLQFKFSQVSYFKNLLYYLIRFDLWFYLSRIREFYF